LSSSPPRCVFSEANRFASGQPVREYRRDQIQPAKRFSAAPPVAFTAAR
jgi:hypothetical protein